MADENPMPKVLVIDDCQMMRTYLRRSLEKGGFEVEDWVPASAGEIPDHIQDSAPDLLLTDFSMAGYNGATVVRLARKAMPGLPAIVLTAFRTEDMEASLLRLGAHRVCTKPIAPAALLEAVHTTLRDRGTGDPER
jgi:DNA-binding NarL/FixJ family response regulator